ncbi:hypothetical protein RvY_11982 [Ramazzottius varieornatus]|uniref:Uncharacterized protein n=1 Tax=Ramazzottius varieornatus TaxID=947166 RepID=A0A1D1VJZ7_RAMVA|nr:hypothetical protein RvY_11982 [Ramazzottius varieornatus]
MNKQGMKYVQNQLQIDEDQGKDKYDGDPQEDLADESLLGMTWRCFQKSEGLSEEREREGTEPDRHVKTVVSSSESKGRKVRVVVEVGVSCLFGSLRLWTRRDSFVPRIFSLGMSSEQRDGLLTTYGSFANWTRLMSFRAHFQPSMKTRPTTEKMSTQADDGIIGRIQANITLKQVLLRFLSILLALSSFCLSEGTGGCGRRVDIWVVLVHVDIVHPRRARRVVHHSRTLRAVRHSLCSAVESKQRFSRKRDTRIILAGLRNTPREDTHPKNNFSTDVFLSCLETGKSFYIGKICKTRTLVFSDPYDIVRVQVAAVQEPEKLEGVSVSLQEPRSWYDLMRPTCHCGDLHDNHVARTHM